MNRLLCLSLFLPLSCFSLAQNHNNVLKLGVVNPLSYTLTYERAFGNYISLSVTGSYVNGTYDGFARRGVEVMPQLRYYFFNYFTLTREAPQGPYLSPFVNYQYIDFRDGVCRCQATYKAGNAGILAGWQFVIARRLAVDVFAGPGFRVQQSTLALPDPIAAGSPVSTPPPGYSLQSQTGLYFNSDSKLYLNPKNGYTSANPNDFNYQPDNFSVPQQLFDKLNLRLGLSVGLWF
jgi:hypothetical protein